MASASSSQVEKEINTLLQQQEDSSKCGRPVEREVLGFIITRLFTSGIGSIAIRELSQRIILLVQNPGFALNDRIDICTKLLAKVEEYQASQEEQIAELRMILANTFEAIDDFHSAAQMLAAIPLNSSQRKITSEDKAATLIRIVRLHLECDDPTSAEIYLNKFKNIMHEVTDPTSLIHFQVSQARIQDSRRDFLAAAKGYEDISLDPNIGEDEQLHTLSMAIKCAVLAPAGPARSRALKRLYGDERSQQLDEFAILENMYLEHLIAPAEIGKFAQGLQEHQLARLSDGLTVLDRAMFEHNLLAASRLYANIGFGPLGELLGIDQERAEEMTAKMIEQGRLGGKIDQIEEIIWFDRGGVVGDEVRRGEGAAGGILRQWDYNVEGLAEGVESIMGKLQAKHPVCAICFLRNTDSLTVA
jgi:COP9 signalosome complex subunit 4